MTGRDHSRRKFCEGLETLMPVRERTFGQQSRCSGRVPSGTRVRRRFVLKMRVEFVYDVRATSYVVRIEGGERGGLFDGGGFGKKDSGK